MSREITAMLNNEKDLAASSRSSFGRAAYIVFVGVVAGALLGPILFSLVSGIPQRPNLIPAIILGLLFGAWIGLVTCILFVFIRRVRAYGRQSMLRMILALAFFGALAGFPILFPFGDGLAMAIALGFESASFGAVIGAVIGIVVFLVVRNERQNPTPGVRPDEKADGG